METTWQSGYSQQVHKERGNMRKHHIGNWSTKAATVALFGTLALASTHAEAAPAPWVYSWEISYYSSLLLKYSEFWSQNGPSSYKNEIKALPSAITLTTSKGPLRDGWVRIRCRKTNNVDYELTKTWPHMAGSSSTTKQLNCDSSSDKHINGLGRVSQY